MPLIGKDRFMKRLRGLSDVTAAANRVVLVGAEMIKGEAQQSITRGSISGKHHVPSAPGSPPNNDTGVLKNNIEAVNTKPLTAEVRSNAPYAAALEFGTSRMAARPYMRPARDKLEPQIQRLFAEEIGKLIKRS